MFSCHLKALPVDFQLYHTTQTFKKLFFNLRIPTELSDLIRKYVLPNKQISKIKLLHPNENCTFHSISLMLWLLSLLRESRLLNLYHMCIYLIDSPCRFDQSKYSVSKNACFSHIFPFVFHKMVMIEYMCSYSCIF